MVQYPKERFLSPYFSSQAAAALVMFSSSCSGDISKATLHRLAGQYSNEIIQNSKHFPWKNLTSVYENSSNSL
jgi:hypothetical protein